jgi:NAD(P)-dependent dehydrogenase (short-subunit alcohol dehydrogenase family)
MNIDGHGVLITGGASGLGLATATLLHSQGAHVVIVDLSADAGQVAAQQIGPRCQFVRADVTNPGDVEEALNAFGATPVRVAVNCAGIAPPARILGKRGPHELDHFKKVIDINLVGTFNVLRLAAERMQRNDALAGDRGVIVMTASIAAFDGQIGQAAYSASKAGVHGLTLTAARDLAEHQIRVVSVAPGIFETPMLLGLPEPAQKALGAAVPHPSRLGKPDEYAQLVAHLIANPMLNGETIRLDGAIRMPPQ